MVEAKESSSFILPFHEKMPTRLGTAIVLAFFDYKRGSTTLLKRLNRGTTNYLQEHEHMLDQFWVSMVPVKFSDQYIGNKPGEKFGSMVGSE